MTLRGYGCVRPQRCLNNNRRYALKEEGHFRTTPGGYFHGMVAKAAAGELHLERTVWAMRRATQPQPERGGGSYRGDSGRSH